MPVNPLAVMHAIAQRRRALSPLTPAAHPSMNTLGGMNEGSGFSPIAPASVLGRPPMGGDPTGQSLSGAPEVSSASPISPTIRPGRQATLTPAREVPTAPSITSEVQGLPANPVSAYAEPTGQLGDRFRGVQEAIQGGDFDPTGLNATSFGPGLEGRGSTPALRFMDAAAQSAGVDTNSVSPAAAETLKGITDTHPINTANWDAFMAGQPLSTNIEDRRGEGFMWWGNKSMGDWTPKDWEDYNKARKDSGGPDNNAQMMDEGKK